MTKRPIKIRNENVLNGYNGHLSQMSWWGDGGSRQCKAGIILAG